MALRQNEKKLILVGNTIDGGEFASYVTLNLLNGEYFDSEINCSLTDDGSDNHPGTCCLPDGLTNYTYLSNCENAFGGIFFHSKNRICMYRILSFSTA